MQVAYQGSVMVVVFCKKNTTVVGNRTFYKGNKLTADGATLFRTNYNYRVMHVLTTFLQTIVRIC